MRSQKNNTINNRLIRSIEDLDLVKMNNVILNGADVNTVSIFSGTSGKTALEYSVISDFKGKSTALLLENGAKITGTALILAVMYKNYNAAKLIREHDKDRIITEKDMAIAKTYAERMFEHLLRI